MRILLVNLTPKRQGGRVYEKMVKESLSKDYCLESINLGTGSKSLFTPLEILWGVFKTSRRKNIDIAIKNFDASLFLNKKPAENIAIVHHVDNSTNSFLRRFVYFFINKIVFLRLKKFESIVTVSEYWKKYFKDKGYNNLILIYNAFDMQEFNIFETEIEQFKEKHNLIDKPIIYLGNCQRAKGVVESYQVLKGLNVYLVTSGKKTVNIPALNLDLNRKDYLKLLKASSMVITMSKFKEGWCRTAHEAMLLKTPVIGSGKGGMKELLEKGKQVICPDFTSLREKVEYLMDHSEIREKMGEEGFNFAKNFTREKFQKRWLQLVDKINSN